METLSKKQEKTLLGMKNDGILSVYDEKDIKKEGKKGITFLIGMNRRQAKGKKNKALQ